MGKTKKSFNINFKEIEALFFNEVFELIKKSGNEQKTLRSIENNIESFKKSIIAKYEDVENKNNNSNIHKNQSNRSSINIDAPAGFPNLIL